MSEFDNFQEDLSLYPEESVEQISVKPGDYSASDNSTAVTRTKLVIVKGSNDECRTQSSSSSFSVCDVSLPLSNQTGHPDFVVENTHEIDKELAVVTSAVAVGLDENFEFEVSRSDNEGKRSREEDHENGTFKKVKLDSNSSDEFLGDYCSIDTSDSIPYTSEDEFISPTDAPMLDEANEELVDRFPDIDSFQDDAGDNTDESADQLVPVGSDPDLVIYSERTSDTLTGEWHAGPSLDWVKGDLENED